MRLVILILFSVFLASCSGSILLKAKYTSKLFDDYFILKKKRYRYYTKLIVNLPKAYGNYAISHDTIYLLSKKKRLFYLDAYAILNLPESSLVVYGLDSTGSKQFHIIHYNR